MQLGSRVHGAPDARFRQPQVACRGIAAVTKRTAFELQSISWVLLLTIEILHDLMYQSPQVFGSTINTRPIRIFTIKSRAT